jgi:nucleotide-binding universal stress UspA family protein
MGLALYARSADVLDEMLGYLVETSDGAVGVLDGCERDEHGHPRSLIVAQGWLSRRRLLVPLDQLAQVDHGRERIVLVPGAAPLGRRDPLRQLADLGQRLWRGGDGEARARGADSGRPVLCGLADDGRGDDVVAVAAELARRLDAPLVLADVVRTERPPSGTRVPGADDRRSTVGPDLGRLRDALVSSVASGLDVSRTVAAGSPAVALAELALERDACLIVVGTGGGEGDWTGEGSAALQLALMAPCPVVVVPP